MALSTGHTIACSDRNRRGGIKAIYLAELTSIDTAQIVNTDQSYDNFPTNSGNFFHKFEFERETAGFTANATKENGSTVVEVELDFIIPKITKEVQKALESLKETCGVVAMVETFADDGSGNTYHFVLGYDQIFTTEAYLDFASGEQASGVAIQDANQTAVKLSARQAEYPYEYGGNIALVSGTEYTTT